MTESPAWYRWSNSNLILYLQIQPRCNQNSFAGLHNNRLKIRLTAPPVDGKANACLREFLAREFKMPKSSINLSHGETERLKTVTLQQPKQLPSAPGLPPITENPL